MRDYALHQAQVSGNIAGAGLLSRLIENWRARKAVAALAKLDDFMLRDIGVSRAEINMLAHGSLTKNAALELEELTRGRQAR